MKLLIHSQTSTVAKWISRCMTRYIMQPKPGVVHDMKMGAASDTMENRPIALLFVVIKQDKTSRTRSHKCRKISKWHPNLERSPPIILQKHIHGNNKHEVSISVSKPNIARPHRKALRHLMNSYPVGTILQVEGHQCMRRTSTSLWRRCYISGQ